MVLAPFLFKARALQALKGNWQTALLVSFFSGVLTTVLSVLSAMLVPDPALYPTPEALMAALEAVPQSTWFLLGGLSLVGLVVNPTLQLGANHYCLPASGNGAGLWGSVPVKLWARACGFPFDWGEGFPVVAAAADAGDHRGDSPAAWLTTTWRRTRAHRLGGLEKSKTPCAQLR